MAYQNIGPGFDLIGTRTKPGQTQLEYFNTQNNQAFGNASQLSSFVNPQYGLNTSPTDVFDVLKTGFTPRDQALNQIKEQLNQFQQDTFNQESAPAKRASSSLADSIATEQGNYDSATKEYQDLVEKLKALNAPNYEQSFAQLRNTAGLPGLESDFANNQKTIRELPYVNRMNFGNAGVATEGQLAADTEQKGIPLEIQQANLLDRLKLASDFVTNSLKFREMDQNASRQSLTDAINATAHTLDLSRTHLQDLLTQNEKEIARQDAARQFAFENRIGKPFYLIGETVYRTSDGKPASDIDQYIAMGGKGDWTDVQELKAPTFNKDNIIGSEALGYYSIDPFTGEKTQILPGTGNTEIKTITDTDGNEHLVLVDKGNRTSSDITPGASGNGGTLSDFINKYAPPSENDTGLYIQQISSRLGVDPNTPLNQIDTNALAVQMALKESGTKIVNGRIVIPSNTLAGKNNNPGNLRYVGQKGATQGAGGFARFATPEAGWQALLNQIDLDKSRAGASTASPEVTSLTNALNSLAPRLTEGGRKSAKATLSNYVKANDLEGAKQFIISTAISSLPADQQNQAFGRLQAIDALSNIENLLAQYRSNGGNTNILTGTQEQIAQKLGNTTNPALANIANQITMAMVAYRRAVSGAAFTEAEAKVYEQLFPSTKNVGTLNEAKIRSLKDVFNLNQKTVLQTVVGARTYDELTKTVQQSPYDQYAKNVSTLSPEQQYAASITSQLTPTQSNNAASKEATKVIASAGLKGVLQSNPLTSALAPVVDIIKNIFR